MMRIRMVDETIARRYAEWKMRCPTHLSVGQEAAAAGVGALLETTDLAVSTHRAHAHYLAKGGDLKAMIAEIYGKATGCSRGRGGSMHLTDRSVGFVGSTAIVGNSIPVGVGLALSLQLKKIPAVCVVYLGDGCVEEGVFYESVNFAAVRKLPVLFCCENNFFSVYSPLNVRQPAGRQIYRMVEALGLPSAIADGNDVTATCNAARTALADIRAGKGPYFLELTTYRWLEHCGPNYDNDLGYRSEAEFLEWKKRDPLAQYQSSLLAGGLISANEVAAMRRDLETEISAAFRFAEESPFPPTDEAFTGLYAETTGLPA